MRICDWEMGCRVSALAPLHCFWNDSSEETRARKPQSPYTRGCRVSGLSARVGIDLGPSVTSKSMDGGDDVSAGPVSLIDHLHLVVSSSAQ